MSHQDNFVFLIIALVLLLAGVAMAQQFFAGTMQRLMQSATVITLLVAVWGSHDRHYLFRSSLIFPVAIVITSTAAYFIENINNLYIHLFLLLIFFIITARKTATQVLFSGPITWNKILGSICLYMLMAMIWALIYTLAQLYAGAAFNGVEEGLQWHQLLPDFVYFSFVTITTLGFGDISPSIPMTKFLVYLEATVGQFYLAILVASLVGGRVTNRSTQEEANHD
ncbi:two pore domain potassium channel family protein [Thalassotalea mangrovi]|uniref:Two pore domain potassium channel family protein n=1 Tax=Thalassotalea mangrovi TaxID=2572245 RepID=A0A4U1B976_9GAMM|nr:two pore domain potassium channel family protein [Thalassotalea mangrovi]